MADRVLQVSNAVLAEMDFSKELSDEEISELISEEVRRICRTDCLGLREREDLELAAFNALRKLDTIQELLDDPEVTEVMVNGPDCIFYEKNGEIFRWPGHFLSEDKLSDVIQKIVGDHNRVVNMSSPIVDTRLKDGSRVNIVLAPVSVDGSAMTIRKFPDHPMTMEELKQRDAISEEAADFLRDAVKTGKSILVSGGTGTGKTTFLNALSAYIPAGERIITIEDSAELQLEGIPNLVRLETRNSNQDRVKEITIRDLIRTALRMRPDRIIVGECRGAEAFDMLQAMNTGHDGSLSSAHANSCRDTLSRLEMMVRMGMDLPLDAIRAQIASGVQLIVHLARLKDRSRRVVEIARLDGIKDGEIRLETLFKREGMGELRKTENGDTKNETENKGFE